MLQLIKSDNIFVFEDNFKGDSSILHFRDPELGNTCLHMSVCAQAYKVLSFLTQRAPEEILNAVN